MGCPNCKAISGRIIITKDGAYCSECTEISETGGAKVSGILTRQASRIRHQQEYHRADVVSPHKYDKASGKVVANPDFVRLYPEHTSKYYSEAEANQAGSKKLKNLWADQDAAEAIHRQNLGDNAPAPRTTKKQKKKIASFVKDL